MTHAMTYVMTYVRAYAMAYAMVYHVCYHACAKLRDNFHTYSQIGHILFHLYDCRLGWW